MSRPSQSITWCHDYTQWKIANKDANRTSATDLRALLTSSGHGTVLRKPCSEIKSADLKSGDVVIIADSHSGIVVTDDGKINHFIQQYGLSGQPYRPQEVEALPSFHSEETIESIAAMKVPRVVYLDPDKPGIVDYRFPYQDKTTEVWRKGGQPAGTSRPPSRPGAASGGQPPQTPPATEDWVIYGTDVGWLRVGPRKEFNEKWQKKDEVWGGNSEDPLGKTLLKDGLANREEALNYLCDHLTKVHVQYGPTATPKEVTAAIFAGREYFLRLERGNDPEVTLYKGQEYDFEAEKRVLMNHGLSPRVVFSRKLWLMHMTGHGTTNGPVQEDRWMTFGAEPKEGHIVLPDGWGGTITYSTDKWEGPYRDNFQLAHAMKRLGVKEVELWPPGNNYSQKVAADEVPDHPKDYGKAMLGVQPYVEPPEMLDWVIYSTEVGWLHIGTRTEFEAPTKKREEAWGGASEDPLRKTLLQEGLFSYSQALRTLCSGLSKVRYGFHPTAQPRETVEGDFRGQHYRLFLARSADSLIARYGQYDCGAELALMLENGITPRKVFRKQWLVHATGHGTYSGPVKDDLWMMVMSEPKDGGVTLPDGMGGTFGYSVNVAAGPFEDSYKLAPVLKQHNLKSMGLYGEDRSVSPEEVGERPKDSGEAPPPKQPRILKIEPETGPPGAEYYITIIGENLEPGCRLSLGPGIEVKNVTWFGRNADGPGEVWLATVKVAENAR